MKILLDECLPRGLARELLGHRVTTVPDAGWSGKSNGELLSLMQGKHDVFLSIDKSLDFQQPETGLRTAILIVHAISNRLDDIRPLLPQILSALKSIQPGEVAHVGSRL